MQAAKEWGPKEQADKVVLKNHTRPKTAFLNCIIYCLLVIYKRKSSINSGEKMYGKKKYNKIIINVIQNVAGASIPFLVTCYLVWPK